MKKKVIYLLPILIIFGIISLVFLNKINNIDAKRAYNYKEIEDNNDETETYELYATISDNQKFNYAEFTLDLNDTHNLSEREKGINLQLVEIEPLLDFQIVKDDRENLEFSLASNTIYTSNEEKEVSFARVVVKKIDPKGLECRFAYIPHSFYETPVNNFDIVKKAMKDGEEITEIYPGDEFDYNLIITGNNTIKTNELIITDTIPDDLIILDYGNASIDGQKLTWNLGAIEKGSYNKTLTVKVKAKENTEATSIKNTAYLKAGDTEDSDDATVKVLHPKITITKQASKKQVNIGDEIYYDLVVKNIGTGIATNVKVTDTYETKYLEYLRVDDNLNIEQNINGNNTNLSFVIDSLKQNETKTIRLYFKVKNDFDENIIPNIAKATYKEQNEEDNEEVEVLRPDLTIEKTVSKDVVKRGEVFTYNIKITNIGNGIARNVRVSDNINSYLEILGASEGTYEDNNYQVLYEILGPKESKSITLTVRVKEEAPLGVINNVAKVKSDEIPEKEDNTDITVTDSKITITKTTNKSVLKPEEEFIYTLTVKNIGDAPTGRITVTDVINSNLEILDSDGASRNGQTLTWIIDKLDINASKSYNIKVKVKKDTPDMIIPNIAKAQEENKDEVESNVDVNVKSPKLELKKEVINTLNNNYVTKKEEYAYKITVTNKGTIASDKITITDTIDNRLTIIDTNGGSKNNNTITWIIDSLAVGESKSFVVKVKVNDNVLDGTIINNKAVLTHKDEKLEDEVDVEVIDDELYIIKEASKDKVQVNEEFSYTIKIGNRGNKEALNINIKDNIPNNLEVISYNITKGNINIDNNILNANINSLSKNEEVIITLNVKVLNGKKDDVIHNTAILSYDDKTLEDSSDVVIIDTDIVVTKDSSVLKTYNNYEYYYTITVSNKGNVDAKNLEVIDTYDEELTIIDANGGIISNNTIKWVIDILRVNEAKTFIIKVKTTNALNNDEVLNKVVVHEEGKPDKSDEVKVIVEDINFSIRKEVNKDKVYKGEEFTYTIIVKNESNMDVDNVTISDQIDSNLIIVKSDAVNNDGILTWTDNFKALEEKKYTIVVTTKKDIDVNQVYNKALLTYLDKYVDSNEVIVTLEELESPQTGSYINYLFIGLSILILIFIYIKIQKKNKFYKI